MSATTPGQPLWHGRFANDPSEQLLAFTVSLPFDQRLAGDDLVGSRAHVRGLFRPNLRDWSNRSVAFGFSTRSDSVTIASAPRIPPTAMLSTVTLGAARRGARPAQPASARQASAKAAIVRAG